MHNEESLPIKDFQYESYSDYTRSGRTLKDYTGVTITSNTLGFAPNVQDNVNHPAHYNTGKTEVIELLEEIAERYGDPKLAYLIATASKYIYRSPYKNNQKEDLEKAVWYLKRAIDHLN